MDRSPLGTPLHERWFLAIETLPFVALIVAMKFASHFFGLEFLSLNSLFTAIISANIFLIGFLVSGVLADFKESEKIPSDMASCLEAMTDEGYIIYKRTKSDAARDYLWKVRDFNRDLICWFYKKERTGTLMRKLFRLNDSFSELEPLAQANFIARMKQEQNNLRRLINRSHTIRETSFLGSGYAITEIITGLLSFGFIFMKYEPFYESLFFISFVSFILIYMIFFIKDIDNPFGYGEKGRGTEEVSLKPLADSQNRIEHCLHRREVSRFVVTLRSPLRVRIANYFVDIKDIPKKYAANQ